jgi:serine O-acetyltransferase
VEGDGSRPSFWRSVQETYEAYLRISFMGKRRGDSPWEETKRKAERVTALLFGTPMPAVLLYYLRRELERRRVPLLPYLCDVLSSALWHVSIGRGVDAQPPLVIPHGHVVIDGLVRMGKNCTVNPWVTIGLGNKRRPGFSFHGPVIGDNVYIGTGAKVLGAVTVGDNARIGANAVVLDDVPPGATAVGAPARIIHTTPPAWQMRSSADA